MEQDYSMLPLLLASLLHRSPSMLIQLPFVFQRYNGVTCITVIVELLRAQCLCSRAPWVVTNIIIIIIIIIII